MKTLETKLPGVVVLEPVIHRDDRGWFQETYRTSSLRDAGILDHFVQENHSRSARGVIRGLHFQWPIAQAKLVRCARGAIWDVVVDIRHDSPTFGQWEAWTLDDERGLQLYCPVGFAHGFAVLSAEADVIYRCSAYYDPSGDRSIRFDDPAIGITWPTGARDVSMRDANAPSLMTAIADIGSWGTP